MFVVKKIAIFIIRMYQALHGSFYMGCCRFEPSCSHYAVEAIETRGVAKGILLAAFRIARCQPFCKGGWDPVPPAPAKRDRLPPFARVPLLRLSTLRRFP
ncbi:MAG: hypothetical protein JWO30_4341 [Fibrobacteres bacterium]|nr:hypothetical protein [Fibrobacterota bacterium]